MVSISFFLCCLSAFRSISKRAVTATAHRCRFLFLSQVISKRTLCTHGITDIDSCISLSFSFCLHCSQGRQHFGPHSERDRPSATHQRATQRAGTPATWLPTQRASERVTNKRVVHTTTFTHVLPHTMVCLLAHGRAGPGWRTLPFQGKTKTPPKKNEQNTQNNHQNIHFFFSPARLASPFGDQQPQGFF
jgi:hypothetical protein